MGNRILRFLTTSFYNLLYKNLRTRDSFLGLITPPRGLNVNIINGHVKNMKIDNWGKNNKMMLDRGCLYGKCKIVLQGNNNVVIIGEGCKLSNLFILVRGNYCKVEIGADTTSNGTSMYCIGEGHKIIIGKDCMFAKDTEIWTSDAHGIINTENGDINK
jgi:hypothetical protein